MIGTHDCAACRRRSYCPYDTCRPRKPEGEALYSSTPDGNAVICPFCGYTESYDDAELRAWAAFNAKRRNSAPDG